MDNVPNRAHDARRKIESAELYKVSGKFKTGTHDPRPRRTRTRQTQKDKAIREDQA